MKTKNRFPCAISVIMAVGVGLLAIEAQAATKKLTLEQAQEYSKKSGRPIFAVAGSAT